MSKNFIKSLAFIITLIAFFSFFLFFPSFNKLNILLISTFIFTIIGLLLLKFKKPLGRKGKITTWLLIISAIIYYGLVYLLSIKTGLVRNNFLLSWNNFLFYALPAMAICVFCEFMRYIVITKARRHRIIYVLTFIAFVIIDILLEVNNQSFLSREGTLKFALRFILPSITKNCLLLYILAVSDIRPALAYQFLFIFTRYLIPYLPNLDEFLSVCIDLTFPIIIIYFMYIYVADIEKEKVTSKSVKWQNKINKKLIIISSVVIWVVILALVLLQSGIFRYRTLTIGSRSMQPTINKGDIILVDQKDKIIDKGEILAFEKDGKIMVHRVLNKLSMGYETKGDANKEKDNWVVIKKEIKGTTKLRVPLLGWPSVWLSEFLH